MGLETLIEQIKSLPSMVNSLQEAIVVTDKSGIIRYHNPQFVDLVGAKDSDDFIGKHIFRDFPFEALEQKIGLLEDALETDETKVSSRVGYSNESSNEKYVNMKISPISEHDAAIISFVDVTRDVMAAIRDGLTGAYSQTYYKTGLKEHVIAEAERSQNKYLGVIGVDLKALNKVNNERSHTAGDTVLKDLVGILQSAVRKIDYVIRDGGDEFLILCPEANKESVGRIINRIYAHINKYNDKVIDPLLKINLYLIGIAGNSDYGDLFTNIEEGINVQKCSSR